MMSREEADILMPFIIAVVFVRIKGSWRFDGSEAYDRSVIC